MNKYHCKSHVMNLSLKLFIFLQLSILIVSFNVEQKPFKSFSYKNQTHHFGFSIAFFKSSTNITGLLIGSPSKTSLNDGNVYYCNWNVSDCTVMKSTFKEKNGQRYGSTIASSKNGHSIVACDPLYEIPDDKFHKAIVGKCLFTEDSTTFNYLLSPCKDQDEQGNTGFGYCQYGFSARMSSTGKYVLSGLIGYKMQTGIVMISNTKNNKHFTTMKNHLGMESFLGYSIDTGYFSSSSSEDIVAGAPHDNLIKGTVYIYHSINSYQTYSTIMDPNPQMGSYFGHSISCLDFNGDGNDDLAVGSPFYSLTVNNGRVVVFLFESIEVKSSMIIDINSNSNSLFGYVVLNAGDLNFDGMDELAVSAPFGGTDKNGEVYIIYNLRTPVDNKKYLVHKIKSIKNNLNMFGLALASNSDIDLNGHNDIGISSLNNTVMVFRTHSLIDLKVNMTTSSGLFNKILIPFETSCQMFDGTLFKWLNCCILALFLLLKINNYFCDSSMVMKFCSQLFESMEMKPNINYMIGKFYSIIIIITIILKLIIIMLIIIIEIKIMILMMLTITMIKIS